VHRRYRRIWLKKLGDADVFLGVGDRCTIDHALICLAVLPISFRTPNNHWLVVSDSSFFTIIFLCRNTYPNRPFLGDRSYTTPKWEQASEIVRIAFGRFRRLQSRNSKVIIIMQPWHCILVLILEYSRQVVKTESPQARHQSLQSGELFIHLEIAILLPLKQRNSRIQNPL
jgi:hypothetical protein